MIEYYEYFEDDTVSCRCDVELDLYDDLGETERQTLLWLFIKEDDRLSPSFQSFFSALNENLTQQLDAVFAGTLSKEGWIECYFYAYDAKKFVNIVSDLLKTHGPYTHEMGSYKDTKWKFYTENLYPEPFQMLLIQNRHTCDALREEGDDLSIVREVEHYLFFQTKSSLQRAIEKMELDGYAFKEHVEDKESDYYYGAIMTKSHSATFEEINLITEFLFDIALNEHGLYEGWSTTLGLNKND